MNKLLFSFTLMLVMFTSPAFAISCADDGRIDYNSTTLGYSSCIGGVEKRLGATITTTACTKEGEIEWTGADLVMCNGAFETSLKCGVSQGACTQSGQQRHEINGMQVCDGSDWYYMSSASCISALSDVSWVAVGYSGQLLVSSDGLDWYAADLPSTYAISFRDVAYGNGRWVAVGLRDSNQEAMITSTDGKTWTAVDISGLAGLYWLTDVSYSDGLWIAREDQFGTNDVITSTDGVNWAKTGTATLGNNGYGLVKGKKYWLTGGAKHYAYSSNEGVSWTDYSWGSTGSWTRDVLYADGVYVITNTVGNTSIVVDEDDVGVSHTIVSTELDTGFASGNKFISGSDAAGNSIKYLNNTTVDGVLGSWTGLATGFDSSNDVKNPIAFGNGQLILASENGEIASTSDFSTVTTAKIPFGAFIRNGAYGGLINDPGPFSFTDATDVSLSAAIISDAVTISATMTSAQKVYAGNGADIRVNGGSWVAGDGTTTVTGGDTLEISLTTPVESLKQVVSTVQVGSHITHWGVKTEEYLASFIMTTSDNNIHISQDGSTWIVLDATAIDASVTDLSGAVYGGDKWVVATEDGIILSSDDGLEWQVSDVTSYYSSGEDMRYLAYGNGRWFVHNYYNADLLTSTDGVNWSEITSAGSGRHMNYYRGDWFAIMGNWVYKKSTDNGLNWTTIKSISVHPASGNVDVCAGNGRVIGVNSSSYMSAYSDDSGTNWTEFDPGTTRFERCAYADGYYVSALVSGAPSFAYSTDGLTWTNNDTSGGATKGRNVEFVNGTWYAADATRLTTTTDITVALNGSTIAYDPASGSIEEFYYGGSHNDPGDFQFTDQTGVSLSTVVNSNSVTMDTSMTSIQNVYASNGAEIRVNGGAWVAGDGTTTITAGDTLEISMTSSSYGALKEKVSTIQVGAHVTHWGAETVDFDDTTAADFTDSTAVTITTVVSSDIIQITDVLAAVNVSIDTVNTSQYRTCSNSDCSTEVQTWTSSPSYIDVNDYIQARHTSSASASTALTSTLTIGDSTVTWQSTTAP